MYISTPTALSRRSAAAPERPHKRTHMNNDFIKSLRSQTSVPEATSAATTAATDFANLIQTEEAEKPKAQPAPPPPVLGVYPVTVIKPAAAVQTLSILFPNAKFTVDEKAEQVMAYATPNEQTAIQAAVDDPVHRVGDTTHRVFGLGLELSGHLA